MPATQINADAGRRKAISLNRRLTLTYILVAIPFVLACGWLMYQRQVALIDKSAALLSVHVQHAADEVGESLTRAEQALAMLAALTAPLSAAECRERLPELMAALDGNVVQNVRVADRDGNVVCAAAEDAGGSVAVSPEFQRSRTSGRFAVAVPSGDAEPLMLAMPIAPRGSQDFAGAVLASLPVGALAGAMSKWSAPAPEGTWLLDETGRTEALQAPGTGAGAVSWLPADKPGGQVRFFHQDDGLLAVAPISAGLGLLARFPDSTALPATISRFALPAAILGGLVLTGLGILLIGLTRWVVEPLQTLDRLILSGSVPTGDDPALSDLPDHIYHLGQSFASRHAEWSRDLQLRELLLEEVHHRIKNSFQMVLSLLRMQERSIKDPEASAILRSAQERVSTLFVVHRLLERSADGEVADAGELVWNIADTLITGGDIAGRITFNVEADPLPLRADQAVVLGLIVNEWLTNSLRHGFPADRKGRIEVLLRLREDVVTLYYADDGVGRSDRSRPGFGTRLISGLVQQLEGDLAALPGPGSRWELRFRMPATKEPQASVAPPGNPASGDA